MHKDYDKGFMTLEDISESNGGSITLTSFSKWDKVLKELIKAGYAVRVYQNEIGSVHISYFEM